MYCNTRNCAQRQNMVGQQQGTASRCASSRPSPASTAIVPRPSTHNASGRGCNQRPFSITSAAATISTVSTRQKKIDFVCSDALPIELLHKIFSFVDFKDFINCTRVNLGWQNLLMDFIWPLLLPGYRSSLLSKMTTQELQLLKASLRGNSSGDGRLLQEQHHWFSLVSATGGNGRLAMLVQMGDCNLYAVEMAGSSFTSMIQVIKSNRSTLTELTIASIVLTPTVAPLFKAIATSERLSKLRFTGPYEIVEDPHRFPTTAKMNSLREITITNFHVEPYCIRNLLPKIRTDRVKFYLKHCPQLRSLVIHPLEDRALLNQKELQEIEAMRPACLSTLQICNERQ